MNRTLLKGKSSRDIGEEASVLRMRSRRRAAGLVRDATGPALVAAGIAVAEQLLAYWPALPEPAMLVMVSLAVAGFMTNLNSAVLSSLIAVTYFLVFVPERHSTHGTGFEMCFEGMFMAVAAPLLAIMGGKIRQEADRSSETLRKHLSNTPLGVIELREEYEVVQWAGSAASIFGIEASQAIGKSLFELPRIFLKPEDARSLHRLLNELEEGKRTRAVHHARTEARDGGQSHSRWFWSSTLDSRDGRSGFLVLVEDITDRVRAEQELAASRAELIERLIKATELRDTDTGAHIVRMARYCEATARAMGLDESECARILAAAPMHDIGKLGVPDSILLKNGPLDQSERQTMEQHTLIGAEVLAGSHTELIQMAEQIALSHHERWNGTGYPNGLRAEQIPLAARICAVCDVFDALTSDRPYKEAWTLDRAAQEIQTMSGSHFDPAVVEAFLRTLPEIERIHGESKRPFDVIFHIAA